MATTASGWPYVEPSDLPVQFPASSQSLAEKLETFGLRGIAALRGSDLAGIASGGQAGFVCTLPAVRAGATVLGFIMHNGTTVGATNWFMGVIPTAVTGVSSTGPQVTTTAGGYFQASWMGRMTANGGDVTLTYSGTTSSGAWTCGTRSLIMLVTL